MASNTSSHTVIHSFLYGAASVLFAVNLYFLARALFAGEYFPVLPLGTGILIAGGLVVILYAEGRARNEDKKEHRRLSRVATQLEQPIMSLEEDIAYLVRESESMPAELKLKLKRMDTRTKVLLENVRDVFLTIRAQQGVVAQEMRVYDTCSVVSEVIEKLRPLAVARNVEVLQKMHCEDAPVRIDKSLFIIALTHLIENGILYTITPGLVNVAVIRSNTHARIVIQDRGIGLKEEDVHNVFTPFARGSYASQYDADGIGVGIALSRMIAREFGGTLTMKQRKDSSGLEFELKLPLAKK
ncbi:MAG: HAMP domain-containing sensor histidine kinase [Candidatus Andersenbacteria bacterium]